MRFSPTLSTQTPKHVVKKNRSFPHSRTTYHFKEFSIFSSFSDCDTVHLLFEAVRIMSALFGFLKNVQENHFWICLIHSQRSSEVRCCVEGKAFLGGCLFKFDVHLSVHCLPRVFFLLLMLQKADLQRFSRYMWVCDEVKSSPTIPRKHSDGN